MQSKRKKDNINSQSIRVNSRLQQKSACDFSKSIFHNSRRNSLCQTDLTMQSSINNYKTMDAAIKDIEIIANKK